MYTPVVTIFIINLFFFCQMKPNRNIAVHQKDTRESVLCFTKKEPEFMVSAILNSVYSDRNGGFTSQYLFVGRVGLCGCGRINHL